MQNYIFSDKQKLFIDYLLNFDDDSDQPPSIPEISKDLQMSTSSCREQIALAKSMGFIDIKPRKGIRILPYSFHPAVSKSVYYALKKNQEYFKQYSDLRNQIEKIYFISSAKILDHKDIEQISEILYAAEKKLYGDPVQIPHKEHREFHLKIYQKNENVFVLGLLESYWDLYEFMGLDVYTDIDYLEKVWSYHRKMIEYIRKREFELAYEALDEHIRLLYKRK